MATKVAAAGGGNWNVGSTWVGGSVPTAADDVQLDATSGNVTIGLAAFCRSLDCTGYTGTLTHSASVTLQIGDATAGTGNVALKLVSGMTYSLGSATTSAIVFSSTSATQQTIATAGKTLGDVTFNGAGSSYLFSDSFTIGSSSTLNFTAGTLNTGNQAVSLGLLTSTNSTARTLTLGSSAITMTGTTSATWSTSGATNLTISANTSVVTFTNTTAGFTSHTNGNWNGLSLVFANTVGTAQIYNNPTLLNVTVNGRANTVNSLLMNAAGVTVTGTLTIAGNSARNRILVCRESNIVGSPLTITAAAVSLTNVDWQDTIAAGAAAPFTGTSMGDALGNTNITFDAPTTQTRSGSGGNWNDVANWTSRIPLPQDSVVVDSGASGTITINCPRLGKDINFTGFAGTLSYSVAPVSYGSLTLGSGMTITGAPSGGYTLSGRGSHTITSNGVTLSPTINILAPGGTYTLGDPLSVVSTGQFVIGPSTNNGTETFNSNNHAMTVPVLTVRGGSRAVLGTSTVNLISTSSTQVLGFSSATSLSARNATFVINNAWSTGRTIFLGGQKIGTLNYTVAGSSGSLTLTSGGTIGTLNFSDTSNARSLLFTAGTTVSISDGFNVNGTAGKLMTIDSATAATHTLNKIYGSVSVDYVSVKNSTATGAAWYAGANSTNVSGNSGWTFTAPPSPPGYGFIEGIGGVSRTIMAQSGFQEISKTPEGPYTLAQDRTVEGIDVLTPMLAEVTVVSEWNVVGAVGKTVVSEWHALGAVSKSTNAEWHVEEETELTTEVDADPVEVDWHVYAIVETETDTEWNASAAVSQSIDSEWHVIGQVSVSVTSEWHVVAIVDDTTVTEWNVLTVVENDADSAWNVRALVNDTTVTEWTILSIISDSTVTEWHVIDIVTVDKEVETAWNVATIVDVVDEIGTDLDTLWNIFSIVSVTTQSTWNLSHVVEQDGNTSWNVKQIVNDTTVSEWNVLTMVDDEATIEWTVLRAVTTNTNTLWNTQLLSAPYVKAPFVSILNNERIADIILTLTEV